MNTAPEAQQGKAKGRMIALVVLIIVVGSLSHIITSSEAVPDRAKFVYDTHQQIVVPCPQVGKPSFFPVPGKFTDVRDSLTSDWDGVTTWAEIKQKSGPLSEYQLSKGQGWDDFVFYGKPIPLWKQLLFRPESRWDEDGYWRY